MGTSKEGGGAQGFLSPGAPPQEGTEGGFKVSGTNVTISAQRLPAQPKGWPNNGIAPVMHPPQLDTSGGGAED